VKTDFYFFIINLSTNATMAKNIDALKQEIAELKTQVQTKHDYQQQSHQPIGRSEGEVDRYQHQLQRQQACISASAQRLIVLQVCQAGEQHQIHAKKIGKHRHPSLGNQSSCLLHHAVYPFRYARKQSQYCVERTITKELAYGQQRLLEIALALATKPKVLLLDEPAAGVPKDESGDLFAAIDGLSRDLSILFIEHDMNIVFRFATRIIVMVSGRILLEGTPAEIAADPRVREVYLGKARHG
jgi:ABC-type branched-subunit amino acid transport system ATPase component